MPNTRAGLAGTKVIIYRHGIAGNPDYSNGRRFYQFALACGVRCAWKVTTVSQSYLEELRWSANGLEALFEYEKGKCVGILNGIDVKVWDPETDSLSR